LCHLTQDEKGAIAQGTRQALGLDNEQILEIHIKEIAE